jgi:hypothetical protein
MTNTLDAKTTASNPALGLCVPCDDNGDETPAVYPGNEFGCPPMCEDCANRSIDRALKDVA